MSQSSDRFRLLTEYAFINDDSLYRKKDQINPNLLEDDDEEDPFANVDDFEDNPSQQDEPEDMDLGSDDVDSDSETDNMDNEMGSDLEIEPAVEPQPGNEDDMNDESSNEISSDGGDIELDVTDIVNDTKESKEASLEASSKIDQLLSNIEQVLQTSTKIDSIIQRMDNIENEIIKRNPTKDEKIEMQSLHSAPYTVKLGDYWADKTDQVLDLSKEGPTFDDIDNPENKQEIEINPEEVKSSYSDIGMNDSYDFEEEEVDDYDI